MLLFKFLKSIHIIAMVCWFAGLFYLPRLFIYHNMTNNAVSKRQFSIMEHKLFWYIMTPAAIVTIVSGETLAHLFNITGTWLHIKILLVITLIIYHIYCFIIMENFIKGYQNKITKWLRIFNEYPHNNINIMR